MLDGPLTDLSLCRHSRLSGSGDIERWLQAAARGLKATYRENVLGARLRHPVKQPGLPYPQRQDLLSPGGWSSLAGPPLCRLCQCMAAARVPHLQCAAAVQLCKCQRGLRVAAIASRADVAVQITGPMRGLHTELTLSITLRLHHRRRPSLEVLQI